MRHEHLTNVVTLVGELNITYFIQLSGTFQCILLLLWLQTILIAGNLQMMTIIKAWYQKWWHCFHEKVQLKCAISSVYFGYGEQSIHACLVAYSQWSCWSVRDCSSQAHVNVMKHLPKYTLEEQFRISKRKQLDACYGIKQPLVFWEWNTMKLLRMGDLLKSRKGQTSLALCT